MRGRRRGPVLMAVASLLLHAAVLGWLAWPAAPDLRATGPDLSAMSIELIAPPRPASRAAPVEPTVLRRAGPAAAASAAVVREEVPAAVAPSSIPAGPPAPPAPAGAAVPDNLRAALRAGTGCTRSASRSRGEREACEERLGQMSASAPTYAAPMDPAKRAYYDELAAAGPSGRTYGDPTPGAVTPGGAAYFRVLNCSMTFGAGKKPKARQGEVRLGRTPCSIPLQGSFFTPEASVRKR